MARHETPHSEPGSRPGWCDRIRLVLGPPYGGRWVPRQHHCLVRLADALPPERHVIDPVSDAAFVGAGYRVGPARARRIVRVPRASDLITHIDRGLDSDMPQALVVPVDVFTLATPLMPMVIREIIPLHSWVSSTGSLILSEEPAPPRSRWYAAAASETFAAAAELDALIVQLERAQPDPDEA